MKTTKAPLKSTKLEFIGLNKWMKQGEYILSTISDDGTIWTYESKILPIFNFENTKVFRVEESGVVEVVGTQKGDEFYFQINGIKVKKIYDYSYAEEIA
jgi:hypothetical protein